MLLLNNNRYHLIILQVLIKIMLLYLPNLLLINSVIKNQMFIIFLILLQIMFQNLFTFLFCPNVKTFLY